MSQYPSPYQPPAPQYGQPHGYSYTPPGHDPGAAGRRAGVLMFVLGALAILGGGLCAVMAAAVAGVMATRPDMVAQLPPEATPDLMRAGMFVLAAIGFLYGIALLTLGFFVRRSSKIAIVTSMVVVVLSLLFLALNLLKGMMLGGQQAAGAVCMCIVPTVLSILLVAWLSQALKNASAVRAAQLYAAQYWQYAQQQAYQRQVWQQQQPPPS